MDNDIHLGRASVIRARVQRIPDHLLEPVDRCLGSRPHSVAGCPLPGDTAVFSDMLEMSVPLRGRSLGRVARHAGRAGRDDDGRFGVLLGNAGVDAILVAPAIAGERGHRARDLGEQDANLGTVVNLLGSQRRGDDLARAGIQADVQLLPGPPRVGAVLVQQPLAGTAQAKARAVH